VSADIGALIPQLQPFAKALVDLAGRAGVQPRVTSTLRSGSQQKRLYAAYLRGESKYPVAPPGFSAHEYGYAFDMVADTPENLHDLGAVWTQWGGLWSPNDEVHFEYPGFVQPSVPVDLPPTEVATVVESADAWLKSLPWYVQLVLPQWLMTESSEGRLKTDSPGGRFLCSHFGIFCKT